MTWAHGGWTREPRKAPRVEGVPMSTTVHFLTCSTAYPFLQRQASLAAYPSLRGLHSFVMNSLQRVAATLRNTRAGRTNRNSFRKTAARVRAYVDDGRGSGAKCAWASKGIPVSLLLAGISYGQEAHAQVLPPCPQPSGSCGLRVLPSPPATPEGWFFNIGEDVAVAASDLFPPLSIYMDNRGLLQTQSLTVSGIDMTDFYVNGSNSAAQPTSR